MTRPLDGAEAFAFAFWRDPKRYTAVVCRACYGEVPDGCGGAQEQLPDCWRKRYRVDQIHDEAILTLKEEKPL